MKVTLPDYSESNVLVVGDVMLDRYWHGPTSRISPEAPVPVVKVEQIEERAGGAANVALNVAGLGGSSLLLGMTGKDEAADALASRLDAVCVETDFYRLPNMPTITKLRILSRHQQLIRLDFEEPFKNVDVQPLLEKIAKGLESADVVIFSDYAKGCLVNVKEMIALAREKGVPVLVDPKGSDFEKYRGATLLTPNFGEFEAVVGPCDDEDDLVAKGKQLIEKFELEALLVTRSEHGMTLIQPGQDELHLPAQAREVFDVTGAGDTVIATLASSLGAGKSLAESCALANAAASVVVAKMGTSTVSPVELANAVGERQEGGFGVVSEKQLMFALDSARKRGEKIVMTNGCFDIIHAGHVSYLNHANSLGDRLVVAVNDDKSVRRLKGEGRPVNTVERRMSVLAGLGAVDWVVAFTEDTPERLISKALPDLLVKGGDYLPEEIAGGQQVIANGGQVKVLNFEEGVSTTEIIDAIRNRED